MINHSLSHLPHGIKPPTTKAAKKAMEITMGLAKIFNAKSLIPVDSVQISGVSYLNLGEPGLLFLEKMALTGKTVVKSTLNPAAFDPMSPPDHVSEEFVTKQKRVVDAYKTMGIEPTLTCSPYLVGNLPMFNSHIAWSESSAVVFANSVIGARTNREGGPSALAAALTGVTPEYGLHLDHNRIPHISISVNFPMDSPLDFGILGAWIGRVIGQKQAFIRLNENNSPHITELQAISASLITYGGASMFHMEGVTPDWFNRTPPSQTISFSKDDSINTLKTISSSPIKGEPVHMVFLGCPHYGPMEIENSREIVNSIGNQILKRLFVGTARTKGIHSLPWSNMAGGCAAVAPIPKGVKTIATNSAKAAFYLGNRGFRILLGDAKQCYLVAKTGEWG
jgi:phosphomecalonate degydratase large subunit